MREEGSRPSQQRQRAKSKENKKLTRFLPYLRLRPSKKHLKKSVKGEVTFIALMDSCSTSSFCTFEAVSRIKNVLTASKYCEIVTMMGKTKAASMPTGSFTLSALDFLQENNTTSIEFQDCFLVDEISPVLHAFPKECKHFIPEEYQEYLDFTIDNSEKVSLLLGQDVLGKLLLSLTPVNPPHDGLTVYHTKFGHVVAGATKLPHACQSNQQTFSTHAHSKVSNGTTTVMLTSTDRLAMVLQEQWRSEKLASDSTELSLEESEALRLYRQSVVYHEKEKRYEVKYPFLSDPFFSNNSRTIFNRYLTLEKRLLRPGNETTYEQYCNYLDEFIQIGNAEKVPDKERDELEQSKYGKHFFAPHFPVESDSISTPCRPVFHFSHSAPKGRDSLGNEVPSQSLNSVMLQGCNMVADLLKQQLKFRRHSVAVLADVKKMFHAVKLHPSHRNYCLFYYRVGGPKNKNQPVDLWRMTSLNFGTKAAPWLAQMTLYENAKRVCELNPENENFKLAKQLLLNNTYVDDVLFSCPDDVTANQRISDMMEINKEGSFFLRKFASNSSTLLSQIDPELRAEGTDIIDMAPDESQCWFISKDQKALGLSWSCKEDAYQFSVPDDKLLQGEFVSRRSMARLISFLGFDTLGYKSCFLLEGRFYIQQSFSESSNPSQDWDDAVSESLAEQFRAWAAMIPELSECRLPRHTPYDRTERFCNGSIILCSDGGSRGCGAVAYIRAFDMVEKEWITRFLCARGRVRNERDLKTIPRCELAGLSLLSKLSETISEAWNVDTKHFTAFIDSEIVYYWTRHTDPLRLNSYVGVRVAQIKSHNLKIRLLGTQDNPADFLTKCHHSVQNTVKSPLWNFGASFFRKCDGECICKHDCSENEWPAENSKPPTELSAELRQLITTEYQKSAVVTMTTRTANAEPCILDSILQKSFSFEKNIMLVVRCLQFIFKAGLSTKKSKGESRLKHFNDRPTHVRDLRTHAELLLVSATQQKHYGEEMKDLLAGRPVSKSSKLAKLNPFISYEITTGKVLLTNTFARSLETRKPVSKYSVKKIIVKHGLPVIRNRSRLNYIVELPHSQRNPYIIPPKCPFAFSLILSIHEQYYHAQVSFVVAQIRLFCHMQALMRQVKVVVHKCISCQKQFTKRAKALIGYLDKNRTLGDGPASGPMSTLAVDLIGPIHTSSQEYPRSQPRKSYVLICVDTASHFCILIRLIDISGPTMIRAMESIHSRYGRLVTGIYSDRATNFRAASLAYQEFLNKPENITDLENRAARAGFRWVHAPSRAPWAMGVVERYCALAKRCLRSAFRKNEIFTNENLSHALDRISSYLNSRPLLSVRAEVCPLEYLSPNSILFGYGCHSDSFDFEFSRAPSAALENHFQRRTVLYRRFVKIFKNQYLSSLRTTQKWARDFPKLKLDQLVLVEDQRYSKKHRFPIGRIVGVPEGNLSRTYQVRLRDSAEVTKDRQGNINFQSMFSGSHPVIVDKNVHSLYPLELDASPHFIEDNCKLHQDTVNLANHTPMYRETTMAFRSLIPRELSSAERDVTY